MERWGIICGKMLSKCMIQVGGERIQKTENGWLLDVNLSTCNDQGGYFRVFVNNAIPHGVHGLGRRFFQLGD